MNAKISVFVICIEAIIYLLLYTLHDCIFNTMADRFDQSLWEIPMAEVF